MPRPRGTCILCKGKRRDPETGAPCLTCGSELDWHEWRARRATDEDGDEPLVANLSRGDEVVRPLRGPAMKQVVGRPVDADRVRAKTVDRSMDGYELFHKKQPLTIVDLGIEWPAQIVCIGDCLSTMYRTDKWHEDGDDEDYKHVHVDDSGKKDVYYEPGKGPRFYEPAKTAKSSRMEAGKGKTIQANGGLPSMPLPKKYQPDSVWRLGYYMGGEVQRHDDGEVYGVFPRGCVLLGSPVKNMLAVYSPKKQPGGDSGIIAIIYGGKLDVLADGIVG